MPAFILTYQACQAPATTTVLPLLAALDPCAMVAHMDVANRALCYAYRNPPSGVKKLSLKQIRPLVKRTDNRRPSLMAISYAPRTFYLEKGTIGRPKGSRKTTKAEERKIMEVFKIRASRCLRCP